MAMLAVDDALAGRSVGLFAPTFKFLGPLVEPIVAALRAIPNISINRSLGEIRIPGGGSLDTWSLDHTSRAGRGRKYHRGILDESAHDEGRLTDAYPFAIKPSLLDYRGSVVAASTPNGLEGWFYDVVHDPKQGFVNFHVPTISNPHLDPEEVAEQRATMPRAEAALQEFDALFIDTGNATIIPLTMLMMDDGQPHADDFPCAAVGLAIDSNSGKGGEGRDGVAAVVFGLTIPGLARGNLDGVTCVLLDWSIMSLSQGGMPAWVESVKRMAMDWFRRLRPLGGPPKAYVEGAGNGYSVIETCRLLGLNPQEIDPKYTLLGKDGRGVACEPHGAKGRIKIGRTAFERRSNYKGVLANHLVKQVTGFKTFDREASRREDDLYDAATYSVLITLGDGNDLRWSRIKRVADRASQQFGVQGTELA